MEICKSLKSIRDNKDLLVHMINIDKDHCLMYLEIEKVLHNTDKFTADFVLRANSPILNITL